MRDKESRGRRMALGLVAWLWLAPAFGLAEEGAVRAGASGPEGAPHRINVLDAGGVADGKTDNTAVFQRLLDAVGRAGGGVVHVPAGRYAIRGNLVIPAHVALEGDAAFVACVLAQEPPVRELKGSVLEAYAGRGGADGPAFIRFGGNNAALKGLTIFYPEWKKEDLPPVAYPPCILGSGVENVAVIDCQLVNPYEGVRMENAHRFLIRNVMGYPIRRGLSIDFCADISRVENVHFWPFNVVYKPEDPYCEWINKNGVAFEFGRTDWQYVLNTFCFGYGVGYRFIDAGRGGCNGNFLGIGADCCTRAVLVEAIQPYGLQITNGEFVGRWTSGDSVTVEIGEQVEGKVSLVNCNFWGPIDRCIWMRASKGQMTAAQCDFRNWDISKQGAPALQVDAGKAIIQGNTFGDGRRHIRIGKETISVLIAANQGARGLEIENQAGERTQAMLNEAFMEK